MLHSLANACFWLSGSLGALAMLVMLYVFYLAQRDKELWSSINKYRLLYLSTEQISIIRVGGGKVISNLCILVDCLVYVSIASMLIFLTVLFNEIATKI